MATLACIVSGAMGSEGAATLPQETELARYAALMEQSPFALATVKEEPPPVVETPSFAKDYYITGMAQLGERPFVTFTSKDKQTFFSLSVGETFQGMKLTAVEWQPELGKSTAKLERHGEVGIVGFDEVVIREAPVVQAPPVAPQTVTNEGQAEGGRSGRRRWTRGGNEGWFDRGGGEGRGWSRRGRAIPSPGQ